MTKDYKQVRKIYFASEHGHNKSYNAYLKRKYNMTLEQYTTLLKSQNNVCAICKNSEVRKANNGKVMKLSVDHNHITGQNRGVLCNKCNLRPLRWKKVSCPNKVWIIVPGKDFQ